MFRMYMYNAWKTSNWSGVETGRVKAGKVKFVRLELCMSQGGFLMTFLRCVVP